MIVTRASEPAVLSVPEGVGPFPGIVLLSEAWGVNDEIKRLALRLGEAGFATAVPDLVSKRGARRAIADALRGEGPTLVQVEETTAWLATDPRWEPSRVGLLGISLGATIALRLAVERRYRVVAAFYGLVSKGSDWSRSCPVVASFAGRDRLMQNSGRELAEALDRAGIPNDIKCYEDASHSFLTQSEPGLRAKVLGLRYDPDAAADSWRRTISFFDRYL